MFSHICTTAPLPTDSKNSNTISNLLSLWNNCGNADKQAFNIHLVHFSDILANCEDESYQNHLTYLITQGRATKQLVVLQMDSFVQIHELKNQRLAEIILQNTECIPLN